MVVICLGPVCIPIYAILPLLLALWVRFKNWIQQWWSGSPAAPSEGACCSGGVCTLNSTSTDPLLNNTEGKNSKYAEWDCDTSEVTHVTSEEEWAQLLVETKAGKPLLVDFTATWCGPCQKIKPFVKELCARVNEGEKKRVRFVMVDVDELDSVSAQCGVAAMPTFQLYVFGEKVSGFSGADQAKLENMLQDFL